MSSASVIIICKLIINIYYARITARVRCLWILFGQYSFCINSLSRARRQPGNFASHERRAKLRRLHDPRSRGDLFHSLSLSSSSRLPLFYVSAIVIKSARRTGRGLLQLPSTPHCSFVGLSPMHSRSAAPVSSTASPFHPPVVRPSVSPSYPLLHRPSPVSPPLSVCHETRVKTYLVRFVRRRERKRRRRAGEEEKSRKEVAARGNESETHVTDPVFSSPLASRCPLGSSAARLSRRNCRDIEECHGGAEFIRGRTISLSYPRVAHRDPGQG